MNTTNSFLACGATLLMALETGCGGAPPPTDRLASTEAAVRGASEVGANSVPQAALHLKLAQEGITKAKALIADDDNERADLVLMRAQSDAELAVALARENTTRADAEQAVDQLKKLRERSK